MERHVGLGIFIVITALTVAVPVLLQVRGGEYRLREVRGYLLFAAGLFVVGLTFTLIGPPTSRYLVWTGLAAAVAGLLAQHRPGPGSEAGE